MFIEFRKALVGVVAAAAFGGLLCAPADAQQRNNQLLAAKSWAYQLTDLTEPNLKKIAESSFDLVVVDYANDAVIPEAPLTREQVASIQRKPDGSRRLIIAYFSAGEIEDYRYYWKPEWQGKGAKRPSWIGAELKEWKRNYKVNYWNPEWQRILYGNAESFVDRIIAAGFDGFYIDRADAYYYFGDTAEKRRQMTDMMISLTRYIRSRKPDAAILVQNAEELLDNAQYVDLIDGIAKEDLYFGITHREEMNKRSDITHSLGLLDAFKKQGKAVFVVEYLVKPFNIDFAKKRMAEHGFVLYYGPRGLYALAGEGPRRGPDDPNPSAPSEAPAKKAVAPKAGKK